MEKPLLVFLLKLGFFDRKIIVLLKYFLIYSASAWVISGVWVTVTTLIGCPKIFRHDGFYYTYRCNDNLTDAAEMLMHVSMHMSYSLPALMLVVYGLVLWKVHSMISYRSLDTKILIQVSKLILFSQLYLFLPFQSLLICVVFEAEAILFAVLPKLEDKMGLFWLSLILDYVLILTASMTSLILLFLNSRIKETVKSFFPCFPAVPRGSSYAQTTYRVYDISDEYGLKLREDKNRKRSENFQEISGV